MTFIYRGRDWLIRDFTVNESNVTIRFGNKVITISLEDWGKIRG
jgi:hypothetical protein